MQPQPFDPLTVPISATGLIEASAGTGKTYNIAALFTRLIVLEQMPVERILVVTFTKAATAELKTRLRARLNDVLSVVEQLHAENTASGADNLSDCLSAACARLCPGDRFTAQLLQQALQKESSGRLVVRLKAAVGRFDNAAVYTIHGFCQRLLRDYAFLCQVPFDVELADDTRSRLLTPAQDFWRENVSADPQAARLAFKYRQTPQTALETVKKFTGRPYLVFRRPENDLESAHKAAETVWQNVKNELPQLEQLFWQVYPALNGNVYRQNTFTGLFALLNEAAAAGQLPEFHEKLEKLPMFAAETLESKTKKAAAPNSAAYGRLNILALLGNSLEQLRLAEQDALAALHFDLLDHLAAALEQHKKNRRERVFDDLLLDVHRALGGAHAEALAQAAASEWHAALIDEFQDTDTLQYEIFSRLFAAQGRPMFLVGDPKQAIYSFRGADIHAYLQAAEDSETRYTLAVNHRSHAKLIRGINALFQQKNRPFVLDNIGYADVDAARAAGRLSPAPPAIRVRWLNRTGEEAASKEILRRRAAEYCADETAALLNEAALGRLNYLKTPEAAARPLQSGQIAVLVRTHGEGRLMAQELKKRGIQSVLISRESVFASEEAAALAALLGFWLQPQQTGPLRFVLGSVLFGFTAARLYALNRDEAALSAWIVSAQNAAAVWQKNGVYAAMQQFAAEHGIEARLLSQNNERSLTNYHQIIERLAEEDAQSRSPAALHQWLLEQVQTASNRDAPPPDSNLLRLESDENLVKIVTMHAAKGLQYPVVFCPFVWDAKKPGNADWQIVRRNGQAELLAPHQADDADRSRLADETLSENLRLLYVALTRAEEQLTIYAAHCGDTPYNALAYLLEGGADASRTDTEAAYAKADKSEKHAVLKNNWLRFTAEAPKDTEFDFTEFAPTPTRYSPPPLSDGLYRAQPIMPRSFEFVRHTSFTGLSRHTAEAAETAREELQPAVDAAESAVSAHRPSETTEGFNIYTFPRGAGAGVCLHEILENFDFRQPAADQSPQIKAALERYGFEPHWQAAVETMLDHTRLAPLGAATLAAAPARNRLPEMAFTLYMRDFKLKHLQQWFAAPCNGLPAECAAAAQLLDFNDVKGFLNGFIDMVCIDSDGSVCVIDYKSNHLGYSAADYGQAAMNEAMAHHHYYLQALIYAVAVARHFRSRNRPVQKIAVRYLFLRGLDGSGNGIWSWDIDTTLLAAWLDA